MKGHFKIGRRKISIQQLSKCIDQKSFSIVYDKENNKYYLNCPVSIECFGRLKDEFKYNKFNESQIEFEKRDIASLDPGVRTFQTVYGLDHSVEIGKNDCYQLYLLLQEKDKTDSKRRKAKIQKRISNLVDELHWKTISFLTTNYKTVLLPEFRISEMVKGKRISRQTKRLMYAFKFYQFELRLKSKAIEKGIDLRMVDESYTSKTCGGCGEINKNLGGKKEFECSKCRINIDRDINGARNILLKNLCLALGDN